MTEEEYELLWMEQMGLCGICRKNARKEAEEINRELSVDHNHATGKPRGLLCNSCNRGLGQVGDTLARAKNVVMYLRGAGHV